MVINELFAKAWEAYEKSGLKPPNLLATENNALRIAASVIVFERDFRKMPNPEEMNVIVKYLGDIEANPPGALQFHHAPTTYADAAPPGLPHEDIRELKTVRTMADVRRFQKNPALMKPFANLKPGSPTFKEFNERIAFIQEHNIEEPATEQETPEQTAKNEAYKKIRERVSRLTAKDCGSSNSGPGQGPWAKVNRKKEELFRVIDLNEKRGTPAEKLAKYVDDEINKLGDSGFRI